MESANNSVEQLITRAEDYAKTSFELSKLKILDNSGHVVSSFVAIAASAIIFLLGLLIVSIGLAFYTGELLGKVYYGFLAVGGGYFVIAILFYFILNSSVKRAVSNWLREKLFR